MRFKINFKKNVFKINFIIIQNKFNDYQTKKIHNLFPDNKI